MHLVYIVRPGQNEELRFSLRSVTANLPVSSLTIVGDAPGWVTGARRIPGNRHSTKPRNVLDNIRLAVNDPDTPDEIVIMNDDFFVLSPLTTIGLHHRGPLAEHITAVDRSWWRTSLERTAAWLHGSGVTDPLSFELHIPFPVHTQGMRRVLDDLGDYAEDNPPQWRTLYGNVAGLASTPHADLKLADRAKTLPPGPFMSTSDAGFYFGAHRALTRAFPHPSPFESRTTRAPKEDAMAPFYENVTSHQIVEDNTGRLDGKARWRKIPAPPAPVVESKTAEVQIPDGKPEKGWTVPQLKAYAEREGIDLGGATTKDPILEVLIPAPPATGADDKTGATGDQKQGD